MNHYLYWILRQQYRNDKNKSNIEKLFFANWKMLNNTGSSYFAGHHGNWNPCILELCPYFDQISVIKEPLKSEVMVLIICEFQLKWYHAKRGLFIFNCQINICYTRKNKHAIAINGYSHMSCANEELSFFKLFFITSSSWLRMTAHYPSTVAQNFFQMLS